MHPTVRGPVHVPTNSQEVRIYVEDKRAIHIILGVFAIIAVGIAPKVAHAQDVTPPVLVAVSASPANVDVSAGPADITLAMTITDDLFQVAQGPLP